MMKSKKDKLKMVKRGYWFYLMVLSWSIVNLVAFVSVEGLILEGGLHAWIFLFLSSVLLIGMSVECYSSCYYKLRRLEQ